ncbi:hypothetical protein MGMO_176c00040 [Methyloglobulus morosus KoM1]|uniref:Uncharacterized protein n=1 Tax=Methyloglobulus morosus KoM1 TaxID=1116472 RepID=V5BQE6_9GAMM|nr:hypothetical protein MGMO_176c00040 [Methyloglobulus morosus KoM1]
MFEPFVLSESKLISLSTGSRRTEVKTSQGRINNILNNYLYLMIDLADNSIKKGSKDDFGGKDFI